MPISVLNSSGVILPLFSVTRADGSKSFGKVLVDGRGAPYSPTNPLLTAPAMSPIEFSDYTGEITTAGATAAIINADLARAAGSIRAGVKNAGTVLVTLQDGAGHAHVEYLDPGASFPLTVGGYVIQDTILISGDTAGDSFSAVIFTVPGAVILRTADTDFQLVADDGTLIAGS